MTDRTKLIELADALAGAFITSEQLGGVDPAKRRFLVKVITQTGGQMDALHDALLAAKVEGWQSEDSLRQEVSGKLAERGAATAFAREKGINDEQLLSFLRGKRPPEPKILEALGLERRTFYRTRATEQQP